MTAKLLNIFRQKDYLRYAAFVLLLLPIFVLRDFLPPNELRYISIIEESIRNNTWFTFYNHGEIYADKPPLYFWILKAIRLATGNHNMWLIGLIGMLPGIGVLAVMDKWMRRYGVGHDRLLSNVSLLTTGMFLGAFLIIRMDMTMTFFITLSLFTFFKIYSGDHRRLDMWLLPLYIFMAVFSKGPVGFLVPFSVITVFLLYKRQIKTFFRYFGWRQWIVMLGLCGLWFLCIYIEGGSEYLHNLTVKQTIGRGVDSFHHKEPVWFYLLNMPFTFAPWSLFFLIAIATGIRRKLMDTDTERFFCVVIASTLVLLSIVSAKINIYLLPVYPFVAYLSSSILYKTGDSGWLKAGAAIPSAVIACALPAFVIARRYIGDFEIEGAIPYIATAIMSAGGGLALWTVFRQSSSKGIVVAGATVVLSLSVLSFAIPSFNKYIGFREMAGTAREKAESGGIGKYVHHRFYTGENMDVFLGRSLEFTKTVESLDSLDMLPEKRILFIRSRHPLKDPELRAFLSAKEQGWATSQYSWYIIGGNNAEKD